jgi:hypothetical protein
MPDHNWRDASAYDYISELSPASLAFEFLRRNRNYRREYNAALSTDASDAVSKASLASPEERWGLTFLDGSRNARRRSNCLLVTARLRLNRHSRARTRSSVSVRA